MAKPKSNNDRRYDFSSPQHFSDLVLVVENTKFYVHKCILSMSSPVFEKMLTASGFIEMDAKQINLPGKQRKEFDAFLQIIYLDEICLINEENYKFLFQLADEYDVVKVKHLCSDFLTSIRVKDSNCLGILIVAEKYDLKDVMEKCAEEASHKPRSVLESSEEFCGLKLESREKIYAKQDQNLNRSSEKYLIPWKTCEGQVASSSIRESQR